MHTIQRLRAQVRLDDPKRALNDAKNAALEGDDDWGRWLEEYQHGDALVVHLEVWLDFETDAPHLLHVHNRGVWVEKNINPPRLEAQIAEIVDKDFELFADQLGAFGFDVDACDLAAMYVHVELEDDLLRALRHPGAQHTVGSAAHEPPVQADAARSGDS